MPFCEPVAHGCFILGGVSSNNYKNHLSCRRYLLYYLVYGEEFQRFFSRSKFSGTGILT